MMDLLGTDVLYRRWDAPSAKAVFLLVHGLGAHTGRWDFLANFFARRGFASYAVELKGFGRTKERPRGHVDSFRVYDRDILALREIIARDHPGKKIFLLGESMGGLIAFNLACRYPDAFAGQILISPAFKNAMKFPVSAYLTLVSLILVKPKKTIALPFTSAMCTADIDYQKIMDENPDEVRSASLKLLLNIMGEQRKSGRLAGDLSVPALFLLAGEDLLVDARASRKLFKKLKLQDKTLLEYPGLRHALSIEAGRERVFEDILHWIEKKI
jgi:alpha-beta hydrolase superfamily lysophospholipase